EGHLNRLSNLNFGRVSVGHHQVSATAAFKVRDGHHCRRVFGGVQEVLGKGKKGCSFIRKANTVEMVFRLATNADALARVLHLAALPADVTVEAVNIIAVSESLRGGSRRGLPARAFRFN